MTYLVQDATRSLELDLVRQPVLSRYFTTRQYFTSTGRHGPRRRGSNARPRRETPLGFDSFYHKFAHSHFVHKVTDTRSIELSRQCATLHRHSDCTNEQDQSCGACGVGASHVKASTARRGCDHTRRKIAHGDPRAALTCGRGPSTATQVVPAPPRTRRTQTSVRLRRLRGRDERSRARASHHTYREQPGPSPHGGPWATCAPPMR